MSRTSSLLDLSYLHKITAGDPALKFTILNMLVDEFDEAIPRLQALWQQEDWIELARFCHHFKSTLSFAGDPQLEEANRYLWEYAESGGSPDPGRLQVHVDLLVAQSAWVKSELQQLLAVGA